MTSFTWLPDAACRGALLLAIVFIVARLLRGQPAAVRHMLWTGTLAGVMAMPLLSAVAPVVPITVPTRVLPLPTPAVPDNLLGIPDVAKVLEDDTGDPVAPPACAGLSSDFGCATEVVTTPSYTWV